MAAIIVAHEKINDDYEWIQYNEKLRLIRSVKDDMYQMKSIVNACQSNKQPTRWIEQAKDDGILDEMASMQKCTDEEIVENRKDLPNELRGYYVHRLLVNAVAI